MPRGPSLSGMTITQLERILEQRRRQANDLRRADKIQAQLNALDRRITRWMAAAAVLAAPDEMAAALAAARPKPAQPCRNHAGHPRKSSKPMSVGDILDAVLKSGYRTSSANFRGIVNQTLIKEKRFGSAGRGLYQMKK